MKKTFKRFLSSALAAVMAASVLSVGMVTSASAASSEPTNHSYGKVELNEAKTVKTWTFTVNMPSSSGSNVTLNAGDTFWDIKFDKVGSGNSTLNKSGNGYLSLQPGAEISIPVPDGKSGKIYVKATSGDEKRNVSFKDGNDTKTLIMNTSETGNSADFTSAAIQNGYITLTAAGGECKIGTIEITLGADQGTFPELVFPEDNLTALTGETSFTADGSDALIKDTNNFIAEGVSSADKNGVKFGKTGSIEFRVNANALLTVAYKSGSSSDATRTSAITLSKFQGKAVFDGVEPIIDDGYAAPGNNTQYNLIYKLTDAGVYRLDLTASNSTQIMSINVEYGKDVPVDSTDAKVLLKSSGTDKVGCIRKGDTYYVVSVVEKETAKNATALKQSTDKGNTELASTDTVYTELELDGISYKPSDIMDGISDDNYYVFASALDGSTDNEYVKIIPDSVASVLKNKVTTNLE